MNLKKAERIELLRCGPVMHSWRRISEIICDEFPNDPEEWRDRGNQMHGIDLCKDAMMFLLGCKDMKQVPDSERERWDT